MDIDINRALQNLGRIYPRLLTVKGERQLFLVGGAIRDLLLGQEPADFDFAVSGSGVEFAREFARAVRGKLVVLSEKDDEARVVYRKKITLDFNGIGNLNIADDLKRRDFTLNAIACELPEANALIDPFGGKEDLKQKLIRPVSAQSLALDPLRLLRALRLALELNFTVHPSVYEQAQDITLQNTAAERIGMEFLRILQANNSVPYLIKLAELHRLEEIMPELLPLLQDEELCAHTFRTVEKIEELISQPGFFSRFTPEWHSYFSLPFHAALLKLAGLLHDIAKPHTRFVNEAGETHFYGHDSLGAKLTVKICHERLRLARHQTKIVRTLVKEHMRLHLLATAPELSERAIRRFFRDLGDEAFGLMLLCYADGWATAGRTGHLEATISRMITQKRAEDAKAKIKRLVTGDDLIAMGLKPGPAFKVILQELEDLQVEGKFKTKEEGLEYLKAYLKRQAEN
ncbi:CCA tRNA nucleotidyltransferase [candidate division WOR-3 bacterium]|nr:CCA tRNA nucleotidyltransferase [candidate division WOR-3 bacterium]